MLTEEQLVKAENKLREITKGMKTKKISSNYPHDKDGKHAIVIGARITRNMLILTKEIRMLQQQNKQLIEALEEIKDEEWHLTGEFTTIYTAAYQALQQIRSKDDEI